MSNTNCNNNQLMMEAGQLACPKGALVGLKKGPWTASEDAILLDYVKKHGEGNWNSVQKNSGLMRCGKSCRLRWANHLRPNLKKGSFTPEEESIIIELHAKLGNKWARMASQLPGRTDNEIKNYWNTRMKRRQRAGLPIYPQEFQAEAAAAFHFPQQQENQQRSHLISSSSSLSSLLSLSRNVTFTPSFFLLDPAINSFSSAPLNPLPNILGTPAFYSNPTQQFRLFGNNTMDDRLALPLSSSPYSQSPCSTNPSKENQASQAIPTVPPTLHYNDADFGNNKSFTSHIMGAPAQQIGIMPGLKCELPSDQTPPGSIASGGGACVVKGSNINNTNDCINRKDTPREMQDNRDNSGLLDALLHESKTISFKGKSHPKETLLAPEREGTEVDEPNKRLKLSLRNGSKTFAEMQCDDLSSSQSSTGMNSMDDDLISLLNNFPSSEQLPDWYHQSRNESNGAAYGGAGDHKCHKTQQDASSLTPGGAAPNLKWELGSCNWKNMSGIC